MRAPLAALLVVVALPAAAQDVPGGRQLYVDFCATCHGVDAMGGGPMAGMLTAAPPDLTRIAERHGRFDRYAVAARIDGRDPMLAHGGEMPIWGWMFDGEDVSMQSETGQPIITSAPVKALVEYLESIQRQDL